MAKLTSSADSLIAEVSAAVREEILGQLQPLIEQITAAAQSLEGALGGTKPKARRGRPPKAAAKKKPGRPKKAAAKKKPGRPKKAAAKKSPGRPKKAAAKRGPGRPPKAAAKRGPGRPPKAAAKRGPGRPPKAAAKKSPGRPKKAASAKKAAPRGKNAPRGALRAAIAEALNAAPKKTLKLTAIRDAVIRKPVFSNRDSMSLYRQIVRDITKMDNVNKAASGNYTIK